MNMVIKWSSYSILSIFFLSLIHGLVFADDEMAENQLDTLRLELIHRNSPMLIRNGKRPKTQLEIIKELHHRDITRQKIFNHKRKQIDDVGHLHHHKGLNKRRKDWEETTSIAMPMNSGVDYGVGEYFVHVKIGSPGQKFMLVADTGSDLTWMNCRYHCGNKCGTYKRRLKKRRTFLADRSSSFKTVPCLSDMCKIELSNLFSLTKCPTPKAPCAYDYRYLERSAAIGIFAKETVSVGLTNGRKRKLHDVLIGCTESTKGYQGGFKGSDGVLGLGFGKHTFTTKAASEFGGKFSYCLVDHLSPKNVSNYLLFGGKRTKSSLLTKMKHTQLLLGGNFGSSYGVNVLGISIGSIMLRIPSEIFDANLGGGTVIDSGTSLTYLTMPAYQIVMEELRKAFSSFDKLSVDGIPFEYCFNSTGFDETIVPRLIIHFADGARFEPPVKSYIIEVTKKTKCIGFVPASWPGTSVIGNIMQQNHFWEFDLKKSTLGFAPSSCT